MLDLIVLYIQHLNENRPKLNIVFEILKYSLLIFGIIEVIGYLLTYFLIINEFDKFPKEKYYQK